MHELIAVRIIFKILHGVSAASHCPVEIHLKKYGLGMSSVDDYFQRDLPIHRMKAISMVVVRECQSGSCGTFADLVEIVRNLLVVVEILSDLFRYRGQDDILEAERV